MFRRLRLRRYPYFEKRGNRAYFAGRKYVLVQIQTDVEFISIRYQRYEEWRRDHRLP